MTHDADMADAATTYICWSYRQLHRSEQNDGYFRCTVHMQGWQVGRDSAITACGVRRNPRLSPSSLSNGWNYESADIARAQWTGCRRCEAAYRAYVRRQQAQSKETPL